jgi:preprotein translocase subunit SecG
VLVSILLALIILVQNPKGGGLATGFQGASQLGGVQKTTDFLEKSTWYLAIALFALCLVSAAFSSKTNVGGDTPVDDIENIDTGAEDEGADAAGAGETLDISNELDPSE